MISKTLLRLRNKEPPCAVTFSWWGDCVPQWPG